MSIHPSIVLSVLAHNLGLFPIQIFQHCLNPMKTFQILITSCIRIMGEGTVFTGVYLSTQSQVLSQVSSPRSFPGYPSSRFFPWSLVQGPFTGGTQSQVLSLVSGLRSFPGGLPQSQLGGGGYPSLSQGTTPVNVVGYPREDRVPPAGTGVLPGLDWGTLQLGLWYPQLGLWYPPSETEQQSEYLLCGEQYASCDHVAGLSFCFRFLSLEYSSDTVAFKLSVLTFWRNNCQVVLQQCKSNTQQSRSLCDVEMSPKATFLLS